MSDLLATVEQSVTNGSPPNPQRHKTLDLFAARMFYSRRQPPLVPLSRKPATGAPTTKSSLPKRSKATSRGLAKASPSRSASAMTAADGDPTEEVGVDEEEDGGQSSSDMDRVLLRLYDPTFYSRRSGKLMKAIAPLRTPLVSMPTKTFVQRFFETPMEQVNRRATQREEAFAARSREMLSKGRKRGSEDDDAGNTTPRRRQKNLVERLHDNTEMRLERERAFHEALKHREEVMTLSSKKKRPSDGAVGSRGRSVSPTAPIP
jgi:hypothetical protein